jgi:hypothetical protein
LEQEERHILPVDMSLHMQELNSLLRLHLTGNDDAVFRSCEYTPAAEQQHSVSIYRMSEMVFEIMCTTPGKEICTPAGLALAACSGVAIGWWLG